MKRLIAGATLAALTLAAAPAFAALAVGATAPAVTGNAYTDGKAAPFSLANELKKGPVVLYFFPAAYTAGCNAEAKAFSESIDKFKAAGASVIGVTAGNGKAGTTMDQALADFSKEHCNGKFPVAAVSTDTVKAYDATLAQRPEWSGRISYVIAPNGKVAYVHNAMNPQEHITKSLEAVTAWKAAQK